MPLELDDITAHIVDASLKLHMRLGPGLFESVYLGLLVPSLVRRGLHVECEKRIEVVIDGIHFKRGLRIDLLVESRVIVELKSIEKLAPVHSKQLLTYLRLMNLPVGLLINFGEATLKDGLKRIVNAYAPPSGRSPRLRVINFDDTAQNTDP